MRPFQYQLLAASAALLLALLIAAPASAFRVIASTSGAAGIAEAPCCGGSFGDFNLSTNEVTTPSVAVNESDQVVIDPPVGVVGPQTVVDLSGAARSSPYTGIGARATIDIADWYPSFTGESIESFSQALYEDDYTLTSPLDNLYLRPIFQVHGTIDHAEGLTSSIRFRMRARLAGDTGLSDTDLLLIQGGTPGTSELVDQQLTGPAVFVGLGGSFFVGLTLTAQVTGSPNDIGAGDQLGEVNFFDSISLVAFEAFADEGLTIPVATDVVSSGGTVIPGVPEPGTGVLVLVGLAITAVTRRRRA